MHNASRLISRASERPRPSDSLTGPGTKSIESIVHCGSSLTGLCRGGSLSHAYRRRPDLSYWCFESRPRLLRRLSYAWCLEAMRQLLRSPWLLSVIDVYLYRVLQTKECSALAHCSPTVHVALSAGRALNDSRRDSR